MMKTFVKHIFFDFDGVLCDSLEACVEEYEHLRLDRFSKLPAVTVDSRMDFAFSGPLKTSLRRWLTDADCRAFFDSHSEAMRSRARFLEPFPGIPELLRNLPAGSASIVSSAYDDAIARVLGRKDGLPPSIKYLKGRDSGWSKTEKISHVLTLENLPPSQAVYVGDLHSDLIYCENVPMQCILVTYGYHSRVHLEGRAVNALALTDSVEELRSLLQNLTRGKEHDAGIAMH